MRLILTFLLLLPCSAAPVQEWCLDRAEGVRIHFLKQNEPALQVLKPVLRQALDRIAAELESEQLEAVDLYLAPDRQKFHELTGGRIPDWGAGCAFPARGRIYIHLEQHDPEALQRTLVHELAHVALFRRAGGVRLPRWFDEGLSMWLAREWQHRQSLDLAVATLAGQVHSLSQLETLLEFPESQARRAYAESFSAVLFLQKIGGRGIWGELLEEVERSGSFEQALPEVLGLSSAEFDEAWVLHVQREFNPLRLMLNSGLLWLGIIGLAVLAYVFTRLRGRRLERAWEEEEKAQDLLE